MPMTPGCVLQRSVAVARKTTKKTTKSKAAPRKTGKKATAGKKKTTSKKETTRKKSSPMRKKTTRASAPKTQASAADPAPVEATAKPKRSTTRRKSAPRSRTAPKPASGPKPASAAAGVATVLDPAIDIRQVLPEAQLRKVKTELTRRDLEEYRRLLLIKRAEIIGDYQQMEEFRNAKDGGDISHMPLHMADVGSDNYEQEFTLGLMESERFLLREIDDALGRIETKTFGVCVVTGQPINRARLEAKPWAKYCIEVARERERLGLAG